MKSMKTETLKNEIKLELIRKGATFLSEGIWSTYLKYEGLKIRLSDHATLKKNAEVHGYADIDIRVNLCKSVESAIKNIDSQVAAYNRFYNYNDILFSTPISENLENLIVKKSKGSLINFLKKSSVNAISRIIENYV